MTLKIFAIYDAKTEAYHQPFFLQTKGQAIRAFSDAANDPKTEFSRHPEDYTLFEIGEYDDQTGSVHNLTVNLALGSALELQSRSKNSLQAVQQ